MSNQQQLNQNTQSMICLSLTDDEFNALVDNLKANNDKISKLNLAISGTNLPLFREITGCVSNTDAALGLLIASKVVNNGAIEPTK